MIIKEVNLNLISQFINFHFNFILSQYIITKLKFIKLDSIIKISLIISM